jgi:NADH dehydrogenase (ubiquinone) 1 beta subcomplex subunit 9
MNTYKLLKNIGVVTKQVEQFTHKQRVVRVYRGLLKNSLNWTITRDKWYPIASELKSEFKRNMYETNPATIAALVEKAETRLRDTQHPDPYIIPYAPGGSKWQRNTPVPYDLTQDDKMINYSQEMHLDYETDYTLQRN